MNLRDGPCEHYQSVRGLDLAPLPTEGVNLDVVREALVQTRARQQLGYERVADELERLVGAGGG